MAGAAMCALTRVSFRETLRETMRFQPRAGVICRTRDHFSTGDSLLAATQEDFDDVL